MRLEKWEDINSKRPLLLWLGFEFQECFNALYHGKRYPRELQKQLCKSKNRFHIQRPITRLPKEGMGSNLKRFNN